MKRRATRRANWFIELITLANRHSYEIEYNDKHQMEQTRNIHTYISVAEICVEGAQDSEAIKAG